MIAPQAILAMCAAALAGLVVVCVALLKGWRDWVGLQRLMIEGRRGETAREPAPMTTRIELADLKERIRKLEAIAAGVEL